MCIVFEFLSILARPRSIICKKQPERIRLYRSRTFTVLLTRFVSSKPPMHCLLTALCTPGVCALRLKWRYRLVAGIQRSTDCQSIENSVLLALLANPGYQLWARFRIDRKSTR